MLLECSAYESINACYLREATRNYVVGIMGPNHETVALLQKSNRKSKPDTYKGTEKA